MTDFSKKIKIIALDKGIKLCDLAKDLGYNRATFAVKLSRGIGYTSDLDKIMDALNCDIVFVDRKTKKVY